MSRSPNEWACRPRHAWRGFGARGGGRHRAARDPLDAAKLGPSLGVFIQVTLEKQTEQMLESFEQSTAAFPR